MATVSRPVSSSARVDQAARDSGAMAGGDPAVKFPSVFRRRWTKAAPVSSASVASRFWIARRFFIATGVRQTLVACRSSPATWPASACRSRSICCAAICAWDSRANRSDCAATCRSARRGRTAIAIIGTTTMNTKKSRSRLRKLGFRSCVLIVGVVTAASRPLHRGSYNRSFTTRASIPARLGAIAQLGERLDRTQEVGGSSPPSSIRGTPAAAGVLPFRARIGGLEFWLRQPCNGPKRAKTPAKVGLLPPIWDHLSTLVKQRFHSPATGQPVRLANGRRPSCCSANAASSRRNWSHRVGGAAVDVRELPWPWQAVREVGPTG